MSSLLLDALTCKKVVRPPVWLMRQAGRYLPQYKDIRKKHSLWTLFHEPELARRVTLLPFQDLSLDAAILFSDLVILPEVFGKKVMYPETGGLRIEPPLLSVEELWVPSKEEMKGKLGFVFETILLVKPDLSVPLLGFSGAPFTLLCYLLEGKVASEFSVVHNWMAHRSEEMHSALEILCEAVITYIHLQIEAGASAIQVFDSWANLLDRQGFMAYCLPYWKRIQEACEDLSVPLIYFSRNTSLYPAEIASFHPDAISFDENRSLSLLRQAVPSTIAVQGNLSPLFLAEASPEDIKKATQEMLISLEGAQGVVLNLGHGVLPQTPLQNVISFVETVRSFA